MQCPICDSTHVKHEHGAPAASCENCKYEWVIGTSVPSLSAPPTQDPTRDIETVARNAYEEVTGKNWLYAGPHLKKRMIAFATNISVQLGHGIHGRT